MWKSLFALALCCFCLACGSSPTRPSAPPAFPTSPDATTTLGVQVVGNTTGPLADVFVGLQLSPGAAVAPGTAALEVPTNAAGIVEWRVVPGRRYSVLVNGQTAITDALVEGDARWLVSMPSSFPCRCRPRR